VSLIGVVERRQIARHVKPFFGTDRLSSFITGLMVSAMNPVRERFGRYDYARHTFIFAAPLEQRSRTDVAKS